VAAALADARAINPQIDVIQMSAWKGDGLQAWFDWLLARIAATRQV
jgi:hydrogenase nickel incorporation protein HypB